MTVWENVDTGLLAGVGQKVTHARGDPGRPERRHLRALCRAAARRRPQSRRAPPGDHREPVRPDPRPAGRGPPPRRRRRDGQRDGRRALARASIRSRRRRCGCRRCWRRPAASRSCPTSRRCRSSAAGGPGGSGCRISTTTRRSTWRCAPGDRIIVEEDRRSFTALGATTGQSRVPFNKRDMSALEAIATVGGLDGRSADPTGVFVFRDEPAEVANRVLGRFDLVGPQRMAYLLEPHAAGGAVLGARVRRSATRTRSTSPRRRSRPGRGCWRSRPGRRCWRAPSS